MIFETAIEREDEFGEIVRLNIAVEVDDDGEGSLDVDDTATVLCRDGEDIYALCPCTQRPSAMTGLPKPSLLIRPTRADIARLCCDADCPHCRGTGRRARVIALTDYEQSEIEADYRQDRSREEAQVAEAAAERRADAAEHRQRGGNA